MKITSTYNNKYNTMFGSSNVILKNINPAYLQRYNEIQRIAKEDNLDIYISKSQESEYLAENDLYTIVAKQDVTQEIKGLGKIELTTHGTNCVLTDKKASAKEISDKIYETVINSVESLAKNIEKRIGEKPNFLKYLTK